MSHPQHPLHPLALNLDTIQTQRYVVQYNAFARCAITEGYVGGVPYADRMGALCIPFRRSIASKLDGVRLVDLGVVPYFDPTRPEQHAWLWHTITIPKDSLEEILLEKERLFTRATELEAAHGRRDQTKSYITYTGVA